MKRITKILILIVLLVTLTGCKDRSHREIFDWLYNGNYKLAVEYESYIWEGLGDCNFYVYELSEIDVEHEFGYILNAEILHNKGIDRIIFSTVMMEGQLSYVIEIIEFESAEDVEKIMSEVNRGNAIFSKYKNIVYHLDTFGPMFVYGMPKFIDEFGYNYNEEILYAFSEENYEEEILVIPNTVKIIKQSGIINSKLVKKIVCGENLEKIGRLAVSGNENLEIFIANEKLKVINFWSLAANPVLKTVKLNDGLEYIGEQAFYDCPSLEYVVIPESVKYIEYEAFTSGTLYCEIKSKPSGWDDDFVTDNVKVYWGNEWEYNEEGIPVLIEE